MANKGTKLGPQSKEHIAKRVAACAAAFKKRGYVPAQNRLTKEEIVERLRPIVSGKYRLRDFEYKGHRDTILTLVCPKHGDFDKPIADVMYSKTGCPRCVGRFTAEEQFELMRKNYPQYTYKPLDKVGCATPIVAICTKHKCTFTFASRTFLKKTCEHPCPRCADEARDEKTYATKLANFSADAAGYRAYRQAVRRVSTRWVKQAGKNHLRTREKHLDHIYSVADGWKEGVQPEIVGHITNLRFLAGRLNQSKSSSSAKTKRQLLADYRNYEKENP